MVFVACAGFKQIFSYTLFFTVYNNNKKLKKKIINVGRNTYDNLSTKIIFEHERKKAHTEKRLNLLL